MPKGDRPHNSGRGTPGVWKKTCSVKWVDKTTRERHACNLSPHDERGFHICDCGVDSRNKQLGRVSGFLRGFADFFFYCEWLKGELPGSGYGWLRFLRFWFKVTHNFNDNTEGTMNNCPKAGTCFCHFCKGAAGMPRQSKKHCGEHNNDCHMKCRK